MNVTFEKDFRPILWTYIATAVFLCIPALIMHASWRNTETTLTGGIVQQKRGAISKTFHTIDLYRVRNVSAADSPLTGGRVILTSNEGTEELRYIKDPNQAASQIRDAVDHERRERGIGAREGL